MSTRSSREGAPSAAEPGRRRSTVAEPPPDRHAMLHAVFQQMVRGKAPLRREPERERKRMAVVS